MLAVKVDAVARPLELVVTTHSLAEGLPPEQVANVPEAPEVGAVKVTLTPGTPVPPAAVTFATSGRGKGAVHGCTLRRSRRSGYRRGLVRWYS